MGCTASKLDNEETVQRCKERRRLMKDAVYARHHLAAAHSDYLRSLRATGTALSVFAAGEPLSISDHTPAVLLRNPSSLSTATTIPPSPPSRVIPSTSPSLNHHPPPQAFSPSPSPTIASSKLPHIRSASSRSASRHHHHHQSHRKPSIKLPHILSESSPSSSPQSKIPSRFNDFPPNFTYNANSSYSNTPSQASSVWNWENFYPPSPPGSEFFEKRSNRDDDKSSVYSKYSQVRSEKGDYRASVYPNLFQKHNHNEDDKSSVYTGSNEQQHEHMERHHHNHHHLTVEEDGEVTEREEVQYSEWDDHYNTTSSSSDENGDGECGSEIGTRSNFGSSVRTESKAPTPSAAPKSKYAKSDDAGSSVSWKPAGNEISDEMKIVVRHRNLVEIVAAIKEYFDKAASAGEQVAEMLESGRAQLDRSFRQLKKTIYHSSGVFSNLSSSWTSKPPLAVKYRFEPGSIDEPGRPRSLCSTLERLLAWEKKLYQEVKAREGVKIEHERKLSSLQSQEYRGGDEAKLDKTKASIQRLQSMIVVTSQAVCTTSSAIIGVRDAEFVPQLVDLCHGFMYMWRSMNQYHEVQHQIVQQVCGLVNRSMKGESTSDLHRQATRDLESAVSAWHSSFCRLIRFQRDFIRSLHGWFKLTILPVNSEPINGNTGNSEAFAFYDEWKLALDRLPDTVASEAIKSFISVVHSIYLKQTEELKVKKRTESASKELEKKASSLRHIEKKYYHSYSMVGIGLQDTGSEYGHVLDARDPLAEKKLELEGCRRRVEDEMLRYSKAVEVTRAMTLNNIQTGLPGVFQAMSSFSALITDALGTVCTRSYVIK